MLDHKYRYAILLLANLYLSSIASNMIAFNFTMIVMGYSQWENSLLLYAVSAGAILASIPYSFLYSKYGARWVLGSAGLLSCLSTAAMPTAAKTSIILFIALRVLQGVAYAACFAAIGMICSRWASLKQQGLFLSCMTVFTSTSVIITNPIAAALSSNPDYGWESVFYIHAAVGPLLFIAWYALYTDFPNRHRCVSGVELEKIERGKSAAHLELHGFIPYRAVCSNRVVLVVWFNAFADLASAIFLQTYLPTYLHRVLGYGIKETGVYSSLPAIAHVVLKVVFGWAFDKIRIWVGPCCSHHSPIGSNYFRTSAQKCG